MKEQTKDKSSDQTTCTQTFHGRPLYGKWVSANRSFWRNWELETENHFVRETRPLLAECFGIKNFESPGSSAMDPSQSVHQG